LKEIEQYEKMPRIFTDAEKEKEWQNKFEQ